MLPYTTSSPLKFHSYLSDPLATFVIRRLGWSPLQFATAYVSLFFLSAGLAVTAYIIKDGAIDVPLTGGYQSLIGTLLYNSVLEGVGGTFYIYISKQPGRLFAEIASVKVINPENGEVQSFIQGEKRSVKSVHRSKNCFWAALAFTAVLLPLTIFGVFMSSNRDETTRYLWLFFVMVLPVWTLGIYMIGMIIVRVLITIWGLYRVFRIGRVNVYPLHPDRCGGLKPVSTYALRLSYMLTGFGIVIGAYSVSQVPEIRESHPQPNTTASISLPSDIQSSSSGMHEETITTDLGRLLKFPALLMAMGIYLVLSPAMFFGTLATAHAPMQQVKNEQLERLSRQFNRDYLFVHRRINALDEGYRQRFDRLQRVDTLYRTTAAFPVWPFDMSSLRTFGAVFSSPLLLTGTTIAIQSAVGNISF